MKPSIKCLGRQAMKLQVWAEIPRHEVEEFIAGRIQSIAAKLYKVANRPSKNPHRSREQSKK